MWDEHSGSYLDPATGEVLPTWDQALDAIGDGDQPRHVVRFGERFHAHGALADSKDAARCIGYLPSTLPSRLATATRPTPMPSARIRRGWRRR